MRAIAGWKVQVQEAEENPASAYKPPVFVFDLIIFRVEILLHSC